MQRTWFFFGGHSATEPGQVHPRSSMGRFFKTFDCDSFNVFPSDPHPPNSFLNKERRKTKKEASSVLFYPVDV